MRSDARSDRLDLARGLPTSHEDTLALRRVRSTRPPTPEEYLDFLAQLPVPTNDELRARRGPRGEPFTLIPR